jgi:hypothetical protein
MAAANYTSALSGKWISNINKLYAMGSHQLPIFLFSQKHRDRHFITATIILDYLFFIKSDRHLIAKFPLTNYFSIDKICLAYIAKTTPFGDLLEVVKLCQGEAG